MPGRRPNVPRPTDSMEVLLPMAVKRTADERFWAKVDRNGSLPKYAPFLGPCWLWLDKPTPGGYGSFYDERRWVAHRWSYQRFVGPIPDGLVIDHLCRVRICVNPAHLEAVTHRENIQRGMSPAVLANRQMRCLKGHPMTEANTVRRGDSDRVRCRTCKNDWQNEWRVGRRERGERTR